MSDAKQPRWSQHLMLLLFGIFTFVPLVAFIAGVRGDAFENQSPVERPTVNRGLLFSTEETAAFDDYLVDALPFREDLVRADARLDIALGDSPSAQVVLGDDGWLFLAQGVEQRCLSASQIDMFVETLSRAERVVASTGRHLVVVVGPDKASVHPERLSAEAPCAAANAQALQGALSPRHVMGWRELVASSAHAQTYFTKDTHWTPTGARTVAELVMDVVDVDAWQGTGRVELGTDATCTGDLSRIIGVPTSEEYSSFSAFAPRGGSDGCAVPQVSTSDIADTSGPWAYMAHDSFGHSLVPFLEPYFSSFVSSPTTNLLGPSTPQDVASAEVIVWESVQRFAFARVATMDLAADLVVALRNDLALQGAIVHWDGPMATIDLDDETGERYILISLEDGTGSAQLIVNGRQRTIDAATPVVGLYADGSVASFELVAGDVNVQIALIEHES